jgi:hypothetical protein
VSERQEGRHPQDAGSRSGRIIRVNIDFEEVLFGRRPVPALNRELEFLAFWLQKDPVHILGSYEDSYLARIAEVTGHDPQWTREPATIDWWGETNRPGMARLNDKVTCFAWWSARYPLEGAICTTREDIARLYRSAPGPWLLKSSRGMSGRGHRLLVREDEWQAVPEDLFPLVMEPLRERTRDLSALWLPEEGRFVVYPNLVDSRFQWRGSVFDGREVDAPRDWLADLTDLQHDLLRQGYDGPFSVDAFVYRTEEGERFHPASEINARRTMGWCAYHFAKILGPGWLLKSRKQKPAPEGAILLSAPQSRLAWWWVPGRAEIPLVRPTTLPTD